MPDFDYQIQPTKHPIHWKTVAIIGGTIVLILLVIFGARWYIKSQATDAKHDAMIERVGEELDAALEACDTNKCRNNKVEEVAQKFGAAELCKKLEGSALTSCAWKVAKEKMVPEECEVITDKEKKIDCYDSVYRILADQGPDMSWCEKITSEIARTRCVNTLSEEIAKEQGCSGTGVDQSVCDSLNLFEAAVESLNPDKCMALGNSGDQVNCLEMMSSIDTDHDGLDATREAELGISDKNWDSDGDGLGDALEVKTYDTDPTKVDSDGDGYSDGAEVKSGYNPLGSGKL